MNTEFKVKVSPKNNEAVCSQSLSMPIHLTEGLIVELALMHKYGINTVLNLSIYASRIFAQRKPNGKLRLLVDLGKIKNLIPVVYVKNNIPVSTLSDAAKHLAGKSLFFKLNCLHACHCFQMANQRSVERLAFILARRTFAWRRLAQGVNRSVSAFKTSCVSTWTQLSKLNNVLSTWTVLELMPTPLRILPGILGQSSSEFVRQDWSWRKNCAILELEKLNTLAQLFHQKELHRKLGRVKIVLDKLRFPKKRHYSASWDS